MNKKKEIILLVSLLVILISLFALIQPIQYFIREYHIYPETVAVLKLVLPIAFIALSVIAIKKSRGNGDTQEDRGKSAKSIFVALFLFVLFLFAQNGRYITRGTSGGVFDKWAKEWAYPNGNKANWIE